MTEATATSDEALMEDLRCGRETALGDLMQRWQLPLRSFLLRYVQDDGDATEIAQDTFVRIYRHRSRYQTGRRFSTWLFHIALNLARDRARRVGRRPISVELEADRHIAEGQTPGASAETEETSRAVQVAIAALPLDLRAALILSVYEQRSHAEISEIVGASVKAVETRIYRARQQLRTTLKAWL